MALRSNPPILRPSYRITPSTLGEGKDFPLNGSSQLGGSHNAMTFSEWMAQVGGAQPTPLYSEVEGPGGPGSRSASTITLSQNQRRLRSSSAPVRRSSPVTFSKRQSTAAAPNSHAHPNTKSAENMVKTAVLRSTASRIRSHSVQSVATRKPRKRSMSVALTNVSDIRLLPAWQGGAHEETMEDGSRVSTRVRLSTSTNQCIPLDRVPLKLLASPRGSIDAVAKHGVGAYLPTRCVDRSSEGPQRITHNYVVSSKLFYEGVLSSAAGPVMGPVGDPSAPSNAAHWALSRWRSSQRPSVTSVASRQPLPFSSLPRDVCSPAARSEDRAVPLSQAPSSSRRNPFHWDETPRLPTALVRSESVRSHVSPSRPVTNILDRIFASTEYATPKKVPSQLPSAALLQGDAAAISSPSLTSTTVRPGPRPHIRHSASNGESEFPTDRRTDHRTAGSFFAQQPCGLSGAPTEADLSPSPPGRGSLNHPCGSLCAVPRCLYPLDSRCQPREESVLNPVFTTRRSTSSSEVRTPGTIAGEYSNFHSVVHPDHVEEARLPLSPLNDGLECTFIPASTCRPCSEIINDTRRSSSPFMANPFTVLSQISSDHSSVTATPSPKTAWGHHENYAYPLVCHTPSPQGSTEYPSSGTPDALMKSGQDQAVPAVDQASPRRTKHNEIITRLPPTPCFCPQKPSKLAPQVQLPNLRKTYDGKENQPTSYDPKVVPSWQSCTTPPHSRLQFPAIVSLGDLGSPGTLTSPGAPTCRRHRSRIDFNAGCP